VPDEGLEGGESVSKRSDVVLSLIRLRNRITKRARKVVAVQLRLTTETTTVDLNNHRGH
jgi:hypothetical protein